MDAVCNVDILVKLRHQTDDQVGFKNDPIANSSVGEGAS